MGILWQDLRYGFRMLWQRPGFTVVAALALALGIGANAAIFTVVNAVLLRPLPYQDPDRLVLVWSTGLPRGLSQMGSALPDFLEWRARNHVFEQMAAFYNDNFNLSSREQPERLLGTRVSASLFPLLGIKAAVGRAFLPAEERFGDHRVVILSYGLWQRRFGADPNLIGQALTLNGEQFTVVGVMPPDFQFPSRRVELWSPIAFAPNDSMGTRNNHFLQVIARGRPTVSVGQAQADMQAIARQIEETYKENTGFGALVVPVREQMVANIRPALLVLFGAVGFVLLIACANVANLLLARAAGRQKEIAIRAALGASRLRVIRQLLTESVLLAGLGGGLGLLLAWWGVDLLIALSPANIPRVQEIRIDGRVLGFTLLVSWLTGMLFGLVPALQASQPDLHDSLKEGGRHGTGGLHGRRVRSLLVVVEVALSLVLLIGAGLMIRSFLRLQEVHPGFQPKNVLTMLIAPPASKYREAHQSAAFFHQVLERVAGLPGVQSAGVTSLLPLAGGGWGKSFTMEDHPAPTHLKEVPTVQYRLVSSDYFRTMGTPILKGRSFSEGDTRESPKVAIINEALVRRFWPNQDPIGQRIFMGAPEHLFPPGLLPAGFHFPRYTIVGVVADAKFRGLSQSAGPEVYVPDLQNHDGPTPMYLVVRTNSDPLALASAVRSQVAAIDKDQPVANVLTMEQLLSDSLAQPRFTMLLLGLFAAVALILAAVGIYGVLAYSVTQRTHEIGIRMALGAEPGAVLKLVVGQGMILALIGVAIGLAAAFGLTRVLSNLLYGVSATDPITFAAISLLLIGVALLASYVPARRAMRVDPMVALRYE